MGKYFTVFIFSFAVFLFFLTPNVNSGDAGELVTASYYMGLAHPSGYPFYLQVGKAFTLLPFGSLAFRVALASAFFSSLSLALICWIVFTLTGSRPAALFSSAVLLSSYSFLTQSVIAKFYPLNLFIIMTIFSLWLYVSIHGFREWALPLTAFLCGLTMTNHHTGILIAAPVILMLFFYRSSLHWKSIATAAVMFFLGFSVYAYAFIRGGSSHFFSSYNVDSVYNFYRMFLRLDYGKGSSLSLSGQTLSDFAQYRHVLCNFLSLLTKNFSMPSYLLAALGSYTLFKLNKKMLIFIFVAIVFFGPFLAKIAFTMPVEQEKDYYLEGHQYFLPAFSFFAVLLGVGFSQILAWMKQSHLVLLPRVLPVAALVLPIIFLISRAADSNYRTNFVPYQAAKDKYSILPVQSVLLAYGDDAIFQSWYLKLIGRYRDDVCELGSAGIKDKVWLDQGCKSALYKTTFPEIMSKRLVHIIPFSSKKRIFGTQMVTSDFAYSKQFYSKDYSMVFLYLPRTSPDVSGRKRPDGIDNFIRDRTLEAEKLINPVVCLSHYTDDFLTRSICGAYISHYAALSRFYSGARYGKAEKTIMMTYFDADKKEQASHTFNLTRANERYLIYSSLIQEHNKWKIFYMREK